MPDPKILVVDPADELASLVRRAADQLRPRPEVSICHRVTSFDEVVDREGPFDVVVAGPGLGDRSGLGRLALLHSECPSMSVVLAFSERPDANLRDVVRIGAVDLVRLPVDDRTFLEVLERAIEMKFATAGEAQRSADGTVIAVTSATGGSGKTFLATNLAYFLRQRSGERTCIVDLDLQFGDVPTALRLRPRYTIVDLLQRDDAEQADLGPYIEEYLVEHDTGVHVLPGPRDPSDADRVQPVDAVRVLLALRSRFQYVIADLPAALTEVVLAALDLSDEIYVTATLDMPSVRDLGVFLSTLAKLKISPGHVRLVLNKEERDLGIDVDHVAKLFDRRFSLVLPYAREVSRSLNVGVPVLAHRPETEISQRLTAGLEELLPVLAGARPRETAGGLVPARRWFKRPRARPEVVSLAAPGS